MMNDLFCHIVLYVLLSSITGAIMYLIWEVVNRTMKNYLSAEVLLIGLEVCLVLFLVPITYIRRVIFMIAFEREFDMNVFDLTPEMMAVLKMLFGIWLVGGITFLTIYVYTEIRFRHDRKMDSYIDESEITNRVLEKLKCDLHMKKNISVYRSTGAKTAFTYGIFKPCIVLSEERFTEEMPLKVVLLHELIHIKKRDSLIGRIGVAVRCVFWFHPLAHIIIKRLSDHIEFRCDELCCSSNSIDENQYFKIIIDSVVHTKSGMFFVYNGLGKTDSELTRRIEHMKNKKHLSGVKKICSVLMAIVIMNIGVVSAYATEAEMSNEYGRIYKNVSGDLKYDMNADFDSDIIKEPYDENDPVEEIDITDTMLARSTNFETGIIPIGVRKYVTLYMRCGQKITITAVISPSDKTAHVGVIEPDGGRMYVVGKGAVSRTFTITTSGTHKIYVENPSALGGISAVVNYSVN